MKKKLSVAAFTYDFPHYRGMIGILKLMMTGHKPDVLLCQPWKKLNIADSEIRFSPRYTDVPETREIAEFFGLECRIGEHNSDEMVSFVKERNIDVGVICGARILNKKIIEAFNVGVINPHPGIIPINRGLDNLKWAINDRIPQAVTTHLIDPRVDMGSIIDIQIVPVLEDDTLIDIHIRQLELMTLMLIEAIEKLESGFVPKPQVEEGTYHKCIPPELEKDLMENFVSYKKDYDQIVKEWESQ